MNRHGGNIDGFHLALRQLATEFPAALLAGARYWELGAKEIAKLLDGNLKQVGHACEFETSLMLHVRPDLVRRAEIADDALAPQPEEMSALYVPLDMLRQILSTSPEPLTRQEILARWPSPSRRPAPTRSGAR